jgi:hypothetical protein
MRVCKFSLERSFVVDYRPGEPFASETARHSRLRGNLQVRRDLHLAALLFVGISIISEINFTITVAGSLSCCSLGFCFTARRARMLGSGMLAPIDPFLTKGTDSIRDRMRGGGERRERRGGRGEGSNPDMEKVHRRVEILRGEGHLPFPYRPMSR